MTRTILLPLFALLGLGAFAQTDLFMLEYPVSFPTGELKEYTDKVNWRGISFGYRKMANENVAVGFDMSTYLFFEKKDKDTYTFETTSITGVQYRHNYSLPISVQVDYVLAPGADIRPYLGMGIGTIYVDRRTDFGIYQFRQDTWQFLLQPEAGISFYLSEGTALSISGNYFAGFDNQEMEGQTFLAGNIGFIWAMN